MFCQYQYYREWTEELQAIVNHSDESYKCGKMPACTYTGTTIINKIPCADCPADAEESDETHDSDW